MADNVAIKLRFRQQVAAEALKNISKRAKRVFLGPMVLARFGSPEDNFSWQEGLQESLHETRRH